MNHVLGGKLKGLDEEFYDRINYSTVGSRSITCVDIKLFILIHL